MRVYAHKAAFEKSRSCFITKIGEIEMFWFGNRLLGVQTKDGTYRLNLSCFWGRELALIRTKQVAFNLDASWVGAQSEDALHDIVGRAAIREFGEYARTRMAGDGA